MAQIIKHRRGSISTLKGTTARNGELIIASGSISDLSGPFVFIGSPNVGDEGVAGAFRSVSKIYQGTSAPTITAGTYGSILDGTPFYSTGNESLYILNNDGAGGNTRIDLTGNIEGNLISGVTINNITGTTANITNISGSFTGSGQGLYNIPASGITGLELNRISSGLATASISEANGLRVNTKTEITGSLTVSGNTYTLGDISITGNTSQTGSIDLTGDITLGGNITIGNQTTDIIQFGGEVSSSILPIVHNSFDLGSSEKNWRNLHVSGTAYIDTLEAQQVNFNDLGVLTDLIVSGSTYLGNGGDITVISGSLYNDQLTDNRVLVAGPNGQISDSQYLTYDEVTLRAGAFEVDIMSGDTRMSGSLTVKNGVTVTGSFKLNDSSTNFSIVGNGFSQTYFQGNGALVWNPGYGGMEVVGDNANLKVGNNLSVVNGVGITGSLGVSGSAQFISTINVDGEATLASATIEDLTDNRIVLAGSGGSLEDDANFTFDGTTFNIGQGNFEIDNADGDIRTSGSLTTNKIYGNTINNNSLHLNGGDLGAPDVELESAGQISLFSEGVGSNFAINMTGSVHMANDLDVTGSLTVSGATTFNNDLTVNGILTVTGETRLQSNLFVSGNLEVLGSATNVNLQSSTVNIGDNIILVNAYSPFQRYAGISGYDSGSIGTSGSLLWDSQNDYWMLVSGSGESSKVIGTTAGTYGTEVNLTSGTFPIATSTNTIGDSLLKYSGTTLSYNTNKFTIDSGTGDTTITGNLTLSYSGGTDNGNKTSMITFKNSDNILGFVSTTETTDVLDGILGYKQSGGGLVFSTVIDGGSY